MTSLKLAFHDEMNRPFEQPWHARLFATTVLLSENGLFSWTEWTGFFGEQLLQANKCNLVKGSDDFYQAWLQTLINLMIEKKITDADCIDEIKERWEEAYKKGPHGKPAHL